VAEFLSAAWIAALDEAARGSPVLAACAGDEPLVIEQRVLLADGESVHHLQLAADGARVRPGPADEPDIVLSTDVETATALARGDVTAQSVLASGRLHVSGELESLARHSTALAAVDDVFAAVRRDTTFPPAGARGSHR
jgi:putative sterol carrier protein